MGNKLDTSTWTGTWRHSLDDARRRLAALGIDTDEAISPLSGYGTMQALTGRYQVLAASNLSYRLKDWVETFVTGNQVAVLVSPRTGYFANVIAADISAEQLVRLAVRRQLAKELGRVEEGWDEALDVVLRAVRQKANSVELQPWDSQMSGGKLPAQVARELGLEWELLTSDGAKSQAALTLPVAQKYAHALVTRGDNGTFLAVYGDAGQLDKFSRSLLTPAW